jgi:hypothetical protein
MNTTTRGELRKLLLHRLTEDEMQRLQDLLAQDANVVEMLRREEADLVNEYALGRLGAREREAFEQYLAQDPAIRERIRMTRAQQGIPAEPEFRMPLWKRGEVRAAAAFVVGLVAIPLLIQLNRKAETAPPIASSVSSGPQAVEQAPAESLTDIVLLADLPRGVVHVPTGAAEIHLQAEATSSDESIFYALTVDDESGARLFSAEDLRPIEHGGHEFVEVSIPGAQLGAGHRIVTLQPQSPGVESFMWQADVQPAH